MKEILVLFLCVSVTTAGRSPNADAVVEMGEIEGWKTSTNPYIDALLDLPELVTRYGYPIEEHKVTTEDGYILTLHRIPHGKNGEKDPNKPPVFVMHGLLSSSADFFVLGPSSSLGYMLADAGYDVWLGNARGNYYSRNHTTISPSNSQFWRFSWDEIGRLDLPASIDHVLATTGHSKTHYIGHSQGGTTFTVMSSLKPEYNDKIVAFHGLAPATFFIHNEFNLMVNLAPLMDFVDTALFTSRTGEILPGWNLWAYIVIGTCSDASFFQSYCHSIPFIGDFIQLYNTTIFPTFIGHAPAGASARQLTHYAQSIQTQQYRRFDFGIKQNVALYGSVQPPLYNLSLITAPTYLYYSLADIFVHPKDVEYFGSMLPNLREMYLIPRQSFRHVDYIWAMDLKESVFDPLMRFMEEAERLA